MRMQRCFRCLVKITGDKRFFNRTILRYYRNLQETAKILECSANKMNQKKKQG